MGKSNLIMVGLFISLAALLLGACASASASSKDESQQVAREFVQIEATFQFDGITETLKLVNTKAVEGGWEFTYEYDNRHAGYGDRDGQMVAQVITHHRAVVTVKSGIVKTAVMDDRWDMLKQEMVGSTPPAGVPAAPNDSVVTGKVIDVISTPAEYPWEITIEVQKSEDVPGFRNGTKEKVGEQITIKTQEDASKLVKGKIITVNVRLAGDEWSHAYLATNVK